MKPMTLKLPKDFLIGYFEDSKDFRKINDNISTPYGRLIAFEASDSRCTVIPGFYLCNLPRTEKGYRRIGVEPVSEENQQRVIKILRKLGYKGSIEFW